MLSDSIFLVQFFETKNTRFYLRLGEVDKTALLLCEVFRGPLLIFSVALVLEHLNLIGAAEIIAATGRDVWHGSLTTRHHTSATWHQLGYRKSSLAHTHKTHRNNKNPSRHNRTYRKKIDRSYAHDDTRNANDVHTC